MEKEITLRFNKTYNINSRGLIKLKCGKEVSLHIREANIIISNKNFIQLKKSDGLNLYINGFEQNKELLQTVFSNIRQVDSVVTLVDNYDPNILYELKKCTIYLYNPNLKLRFDPENKIYLSIHRNNPPINNFQIENVYELSVYGLFVEGYQQHERDIIDIIKQSLDLKSLTLVFDSYGSQEILDYIDTIISISNLDELFINSLKYEQTIIEFYLPSLSSSSISKLVITPKGTIIEYSIDINYILTDCPNITSIGFLSHFKPENLINNYSITSLLYASEDIDVILKRNLDYMMERRFKKTKVVQNS